MYATRELAPFPGPSDESETITLGTLAQELLRADSPAPLIHGGPGSGKTSAIRGLAELLAAGGGIALGPFDATELRNPKHPAAVFSALAARILAEIKQRFADGRDDDGAASGTSPEGQMRAIGQALEHLAKRSVRTVLLVDNFDHVHPWALLGVAKFLRAIFDRHKAWFSFVLTLESDLDELGQEHLYSPMRNISVPYLLMDLGRGEARAHALALARERGIELRAEEELELWAEVRGYPALIAAFVEVLARGRKQRFDFSVADSRDELLARHRRFEPMFTTGRRILELSSLALDGENPAHVLRQMVAGEDPEIGDRGARTLLAMGILGWRRGGSILTWRSPFIQAFWQRLEDEGRRISIAIDRSKAFQEGTVNAEGSVLVSLFIDLGPLLLAEDQLGFNNLRGTREWTKRLRDLPGTLREGPFARWSQQQDLIDLGQDLDLFRQRVIDQSFMPVYEASPEELELDFERLPGRFASRDDPEVRQRAREVLEREYLKWDRARVQLTRDGAAHVTLVRDLSHPLPLMHLLNDLLGLESELEGADLSVDWELALAVVEAFVAQLAGPTDSGSPVPALGLRWRKTARPGAAAPYPLRDRYVIYLLRKLCRCRFGKLATTAGQPLIKMGEFDLHRDTSEHHQQAAEIASLLEGVMIRKQLSPDSDIGEFPGLKPQDVQRILKDDLSSWRNECFVASLDNALLVYQATEKKLDRPGPGSPEDGPVSGGGAADEICRVCRRPESRVIRDLYFPQATVPYEGYWQCLALGLQYLIELRWSAQWIADQTTNDLQDLAVLMVESVEERNAARVTQLAKNLALTTRLLSHLRDASIPLSIAGSGYAARKYERLIEVSGLRETVENAEKNIAGINDFLRHHDGQLTQLRNQKYTRVVGLAGGALAVLALILSLPSMWIDFSGGTEDSSFWGFLQGLGIPEGFRTSAQLGLSLAALGLIVYVGFRVWRVWKELTSKPPEEWGPA